MASHVSPQNLPFKYCAGGSGAENFGDPINYAFAGATFLIILTLTIFGKGFLRGAAPLIVLAVGFVIAALTGNVDFTPVQEPLVQLSLE